MNAEPQTEFTEDLLVAFLCGIGSDVERARIERALDVDDELQAHVAFLRALMPHAQTVRAADVVDADQQRTSFETVQLKPVDETAYASRKADDDSAAESPQLPENLRVVAELDRKGLSAAQIAERIGTTRTLVELKLRRIQSLRNEDRG